MGNLLPHGAAHVQTQADVPVNAQVRVLDRLTQLLKIELHICLDAVFAAAVCAVLLVAPACRVFGETAGLWAGGLGAAALFVLAHCRRFGIAKQNPIMVSGEVDFGPAHANPSKHHWHQHQRADDATFLTTSEIVNFSQAATTAAGFEFAEPPTVILVPTLLDANHTTNVRILVSAENVTRTKFTAKFQTWWDTRIERFGCKWYAFGVPAASHL